MLSCAGLVSIISFIEPNEKAPLFPSSIGSASIPDSGSGLGAGVAPSNAGLPLSNAPPEPKTEPLLELLTAPKPVGLPAIELNAEFVPVEPGVEGLSNADDWPKAGVAVVPNAEGLDAAAPEPDDWPKAGEPNAEVPEALPNAEGDAVLPNAEGVDVLPKAGAEFVLPAAPKADPDDDPNTDFAPPKAPNPPPDAVWPNAGLPKADGPEVDPKAGAPGVEVDPKAGALGVDVDPNAEALGVDVEPNAGAFGVDVDPNAAALGVEVDPNAVALDGGGGAWPCAAPCVAWTMPG